MEKNNMSYEVLFVVDLTPGEEGVKALIEKFTSLIAENGEVTEVAEWGKKRLAYPINDKVEGYYVLVNFKAEGTLPAELDRIFGITEGIYRHIVIRHEDKKAAKTAKVEA